jgi:hypothetical protein
MIKPDGAETRMERAGRFSLAEAYSIAVKRENLCNGAIWMMSDHHLITMVTGEAKWPRTVFLELQFE